MSRLMIRVSVKQLFSGIWAHSAGRWNAEAAARGGEAGNADAAADPGHGHCVPAGFTVPSTNNRQ
jgi:hypothetical protein